MRHIRRRIRSVQSTKKITRAMELIASSRIIKAESQLKSAQPYAGQMASVVDNLASAVGGSVQHPFFEEREVLRSAVLVMTSDRGLAGAYNANVLKLALQSLEEMPGETKTMIAVGRKAEAFFRYRGIPADRVWVGVADRPTYADAVQVADHIVGRFLDGELDHVRLVYTKFASMFRQVPQTEALLPVRPPAAVDEDEESELRVPGASRDEAPSADTSFEPAPGEILQSILPKGVTSQIFVAMLEAAASEHASRRRAMKAATDNATDLIRALELAGNKARQAAITTEIIEIVGGAKALEQVVMEEN